MLVVMPLSALLFLLGSFLVAQGVPHERRVAADAKTAAANAATCAKATTCEECIGKKFTGGQCGFTFAAPNKCVPSGGAQAVATKAAQCKSLAQSNADNAAGSDDAARATKAAAIFNKISSHVFQGSSAKKTSGRHLATTWIKANTNKGLKNTAATSIQTFPFGLQGRKTKTVWNDDDENGGRYTQAIVTKMCTDAIVASMVANKSKDTPKSGTSSFSVASFPGGPPICVTFSQDSCFPDPVATEAALGKPCTPSNAGQDDDA